jgi:hypothetical protein
MRFAILQFESGLLKQEGMLCWGGGYSIGKGNGSGSNNNHKKE